MTGHFRDVYVSLYVTYDRHKRSYVPSDFAVERLQKAIDNNNVREINQILTITRLTFNNRPARGKRRFT